MFQTFRAAWRALQSLRMSQSLVVVELRQEHQAVLRADGYQVEPSPYGWIVRR